MLELNEGLDLDDVNDVVCNAREVTLGAPLLERVDTSHAFLEAFAANKIIYGVNTGFGPMAQYRIDDANREQLQLNLIRSHASGTGALMSPTHVRATMLARLNTLGLGFSGIHRNALELLVALLNKRITPLIHEHGGVGASGDLVQLAHLALVLIGEGEVFKDGQRAPTAEVFAQEGLSPLRMRIREGLALMNGTSSMNGIGLVNCILARRLLGWMIKCSAAINELVQTYDDHLSESLNASKRHPGQRAVAARMREHLSDSTLVRDRGEHLYTAEAKSDVFREKVQEYYSLRCVPQILGPVQDTLENTVRVLVDELNSANDNPIIDVAGQHVYHGGNFHGDYVSLEMDKLKLVVTRMSTLAERQLNYLMNPKINDVLPPFTNLGTLGLNFGLQGVQFTATSTAAENQMLANSMYVHSIPNNNDNQDVVSMGTNAALITARVIDNAFEVVAIELMAIAQALDYLELHEQASTATRSMYDSIRGIVPKTVTDHPHYTSVNALKAHISRLD
ncbi:MAG: histidine ammonia-lyase [Gammaproteobacteria bacterium]|nr:MAG: histidine ammonia-lyase [Gammaproteobacteria bacterium]